SSRPARGDCASCVLAFGPATHAARPDPVPSPHPFRAVPRSTSLLPKEPRCRGSAGPVNRAKLSVPSWHYSVEGRKRAGPSGERSLEIQELEELIGRAQ